MTEAQEKAEDALIKKYNEKRWSAYRKVLTGEFSTYDELEVNLMTLNEMFKDELHEIDGFKDYDSWFTLSSDINSVMESESLGVPIVEFVWNRLRIHNLVMSIPFENLLSRRVFTNQHGQICDEHGVLLSEDGEHRVFEVIPGGKNCPD